MVARIVVVGVVVVIAVVVGRSWRRRAVPRQRPVDVGGLGLPAGIVLFTATACANCGGARKRIEQLGLPIREVTWELEPGLFEAAGVETVPLTLFVDAGEEVVAQLSGVPTANSLRTAAAALARA